VVGAGRFERSSDRVTHRNGHRRRVLSTKAGDLTVGIPKLRKGSFFPEILEPRRRIDQALYAVVMEAYVNGVSTRAVDDLVAAMGVAGARTHTPTHPPTHTTHTACGCHRPPRQLVSSRARASSGKAASAPV
jgi:transposase-like protein